MKLSNVFAKLTGVRSKTMGVLAAATLAGAIFTTAVPQAEAQHFAVGVQFGGPRYYAPPPPPPRFYGPGYGYVYRPYGYGYGFHEREWRWHHDPYRRW